MKKMLFCLLLALIMVSCDADKELDKAFASAGLVRINAPRGDYAPGAVILRGKKLTISADNIADYVDGAVPIYNSDKSKEVSAVLPSIKVTKNINPSLAADFIASAIPINGTLNLRFTSNVNIDQMDCRIANIKIADLQKFLKDPKNAALSEAFKGFAKEKAEIYIAFEVWKASSISLSSATGSNIDAEAKVGEVKPILNSADVKFSYAKTSEKALKITGDKFYPFALRLAKIEINPNTGALSLSLTNFKTTIDVKAASEEAYSALPDGGGSAISISSVSRDKVASALAEE